MHRRPLAVHVWVYIVAAVVVLLLALARALLDPPTVVRLVLPTLTPR